MRDYHEEERIAALRSYGMLDTPAELEFDHIVQEAAREFDAPIALVSLVDDDRQWFKARVGLDVSHTPRSMSFCTHAIQGPDVLVIKNAQHDERFADNSLVTGDPNIRFYAGAPLKTPEGRRIGTLCVIDRTPREGLTHEQKAKLEALAERTMEAFARRQKRRALIGDTRAA